jgi:hypothetical protein
MKAWKLISAAALLAALAAPVSGSAANPCDDPYVKLLQPSGGQVVVNGVVVQTAGGQSLTLSSTGTIDVVIEHACANLVTLTVTKQSPLGDTVIHTNSWDGLHCDIGKLTDTVTIGLDGGQYRFDLGGNSCIGRKFRSDGHGGTVLDPPLPQLI